MGEKGRKDTKAMAGIQEGAARAALSKDAQSQKLLAGAKSLGNAEMQKKLDGKNAKRDEMLAFLCKRLDTMRNVQQREVTQASKQAMSKDKNLLSDGGDKKNFESNPLKWRIPAQVYEQAANALCQGDLHRGSQLVEKAMSEERRCFEQISGHIDLHDVDTGLGSVPTEAMETRPGETCGECSTPEGVDAAAAIDRVETEPAQMANAMRVRDPIREEEEEEEQDKGKGQAGAGDSKKA